MLLEFSAAKKALQPTEGAHLEGFLDHMDFPPIDALGGDMAERIIMRRDSRRMAMGATLAKVGGKPAEALALYDEAYGHAPADPYVLAIYIENHISAGDALSSMGDYKTAAEHYRKALVEPGYPESGASHHGLALCYWALGDYENAYRNLKFSLAKNPYNAAGHYNLARLEFMKGDIEAAISSYEKTLELVPDDARAANNLARIYAEKGQNLEVALHLAELAVSVMREADHYNTLGWVLHRRGELDRAGKAYTAALKLEPTNSESLYRLAAVELVRANKDEAHRLLTLLEGQNRDDEYSRSAKAILEKLGTGK
jgi:tetratricopeptide (TPR) repeat protein